MSKIKSSNFTDIAECIFMDSRQRNVIFVPKINKILLFKEFYLEAIDLGSKVLVKSQFA